MNNKEFFIKNKIYVVDLDAYNYAASLMLMNAQQSKNEEIQQRAIQSIIVQAIGLNQMLSIPANDMAVIFPAILNILVAAEDS